MECSLERTPSGPKSLSEMWADKVMERVEAFTQKYPPHARTLLYAEPDAFREYVDIGCTIIEHLEHENWPLIQAIMDKPRVFQDMDDDLLLDAVSILWLIDSQNEESSQKIEEEKKSGQWRATSISLIKQFDKVQPLGLRLQELGVPEHKIYKLRWAALVEHVKFKVGIR